MPRDADVEAVAGQRDGDRAADARVRAGDDRDACHVGWVASTLRRKTVFSNAGFGNEGGMSERSVERAARNQVRFREANERIDERRRELGVGSARFPLLCECEREECTQIISVRPEEYEAVREHPRRFLVVEEHVGGGARVISRHGGFVVVEKEGREGELVEEQVSG
jgi:hypothetical protein